MADQPVANQPAVPSQTETTTEGAPDELDTLLAQYDSGQKPAEPAKPEAETLDSFKESVTEIRNFVDQEKAKRTSTDIADAVKSVKGEMEVSDKMTRARMEVEAQDDPRFKTAWEQRANNPAGWEKVLSAFGQKFAAEMDASKINKSATEDRRAVEASVRGATKTPDDTQLTPEQTAAWSPSEWQDWRRKHGYVSY